VSELVSPPSDAALPQDPGPETEPGTSPAVPVQATPVEPLRTAAGGTTAGTVFAGRYRLSIRVGTDPAAGAEFWQAVDTVLRRDVAVTVLRRLGPDSAGADPGWGDRAEEMVSRALRSGSFEHRGCARLLDVLTSGAGGLPRDVLGVAVTEWVPGRSLAEAVSSGLLRPLTAARALVPLAAAAEAAHVHGLVLGCDHPQRIRITPDGRAQVCFAMPRPETTPADDVRGLGAVLYTLLTAQWPLSRADAARAGLDAARRGADDVPVLPSTQRPGVPVELDTLSAGALGPESTPGHIHTAASVRALLDQVVEEDDRIALFPPVRDGVPAEPGDVWQESDKPTPPDPRRRRKLALGLVALGVAVVAVLGGIGSQVVSMFSSGNPAIVVPGTVPGPDPAPSGARADGAVRPNSYDVYNTVGDPDNRDRVGRIFDGDPRSFWATATYNQQFPLYKPGIGVMVSFDQAFQLADLTIESPSAGTVVQILSAPAANSALEQTKPMAEPVTLQAGQTTIRLPDSQPVTHVLVWITKLSGPNGEISAQINEIRFRRATG
jgi:hypothetical protein